MSGSFTYANEYGDLESVPITGSEDSFSSWSTMTPLADQYEANSQSPIDPATQAAIEAEASSATAAAQAAASQAQQAKSPPVVSEFSEEFKDAELIAKTHQKCLFDRIEVASDIFQSRTNSINYPTSDAATGVSVNQKPYKYVSMVSGKPYSFMNALTSVPGASKYLSMKQSSEGSYGAKTPQVRIFKVVYDSVGKDRKVVKQIEIPFPTDYAPADERLKVALLKMSYELGGTNSVSALSDIKFQMSIYFKDFHGLLAERESISEEFPGKYKYIDLATKILNPLEDEQQSIASKPTKKGQDLINIDGFFEIRVDLYYEPDEKDPELTDKELIEAIRNQKRSFFLSPIESSFDFDEFGAFTLKIDYRARLAQVLNKERTFNILTGTKAQQKKILACKMILEEYKDSVKELEKKLKNAASETQKNDVQAEIDLFKKDLFPDNTWIAWFSPWEYGQKDKGLLAFLKEKLEEGQQEAADTAYKKFTNFLLSRDRLYFAKVSKENGLISFDIGKTFEAMGAQPSGLSSDEYGSQFSKLIQESMQELNTQDAISGAAFTEEIYYQLESVGFGADSDGVQTEELSVNDHGLAFVNQAKLALGVINPERTGYALSLDSNIVWENYPYLTGEQIDKLNSGDYYHSSRVVDFIKRDIIRRENERRAKNKSNNSNTKASQQGKGGQAASATDQTQIEKQGAYYIPWFFLGDIVEFAAKESIGNYVLESEITAKRAEINFSIFTGVESIDVDYGYKPQPTSDFLKKTKILLGPINYRSSDGGPASFPASLAELPVSFNFFKTWWKKNVIDPGKKTYSLSNFITDCTRDFTVEKFYLESASSNDVAKQLVPRKQVVDLPFDGGQPPLRAGERIEMTTLLANLPNRNNTVSNVEFCHYLVFYMMNSDTYDMTGNEEEDKKNHIPHLYYRPADGRTRIRSVSFDPVDVEGLRQMKAFEVGAFDPLSELARVYNLSIEMDMNFCFFPGQYLFFNPIGFGASLGQPTNPNSISRKLGIGGYHLVTNVKSSFDRATSSYSTTIEARWQTSGGSGSRALFASQDTTGDGAVPVSPTEEDATTQNIDLEELQG